MTVDKVYIYNDIYCIVHDLAHESFCNMQTHECKQYIIDNLPICQNQNLKLDDLHFRYLELNKLDDNPYALCDLRLEVNFLCDDVDLRFLQMFFKKFLQMLSKKYNVYGIANFYNSSDILLQYK